MLSRWLTTGLVVTLVGCATGPYVNNYPQQLADARVKNLEKAHIKGDEYSKQTRKTSATLVRSGKNQQINLNNFSAQRGDKVLLEDGYYGDLANLNLQGVALVGKGIGKTVIGSNLGNRLKVDNTIFQDLTLVAPQFHFTSNKGVKIVGSAVIGKVNISGDKNVDLAGPLLDLAFSDIFYSDLDEKYPYSAFLYVRRAFSIGAHDDYNFRMFVPSRQWRSITDEPTFKAKVIPWVPGETDRSDRGLNFEPRFVKEYYAVRDLIGADFQKGKLFFGVVPMFYQGQTNNIVYNYETAESVRQTALYSREKFERQTELVDWTTEYLKEKYPQIQDSRDTAKINDLKNKAESAVARGNKLVAVALYVELDKTEKFSNHIEIRRKIASLTSGLRADLTCGLWQKLDPQFPDNKDTFAQLRRDLSVKLPLMDFGAKNNHCNIDVGYAYVGKVQNSNQLGNVLKKEDILDKSEERKQRDAEIAMAQAAAARSREKAQMAKFNSAGDRGKEISQKMLDGRVRTETWGNKQMLVHGSGNFGSQGNAATNSQIAANNSAASSAQARANSLKGNQAGDYVKVGERVTQAYSETSSSQYSMNLNFSIHGKKFHFKGPIQSNTFTRQCTKVTNSNSNMGIVDDCKYIFGGRTTDYTSQFLEPYIRSYLQNNHFKMKAQTISAGLASNDPEKKLEAYLLAIAYGYPAVESIAPDLALKVLGVNETKSGLADRLFTAIY